MRWRDERGSSEPIAFLALMPMVVIVILIVLQITLYGYTLVVMESAARDAARASAARGNPVPVVEAITQGTGIRMVVGESCPPGSGAVTVGVTAQVPRLVPYLDDSLLTLHRRVLILREGNCP